MIKYIKIMVTVFTLLISCSSDKYRRNEVIQMMLLEEKIDISENIN